MRYGVFKKTAVLLIVFSTGAQANPTYTKDIQPIFKNRCSKCHDYMPGRNWQNYDNAFEFRLKIKDKILSKEMPMGQDMPQEERNLIVKWVDTGSQK